MDVGCGSGRAINWLAARFPRSRFRGVDLCEDALAGARREASQKGLTNARFDALDAAAIRDEGAFDLVTTFDAVHDQGDPAGVLRNIRRALRPGGVYLMQDIGLSSALERNTEHPIAAYIYTISCMHCMTVSLAQGGAGLGAAWGVEMAERMLREAGFGSVSVHRLPHDILNAYFVNRP